jgi:hypothetical protein
MLGSTYDLKDPSSWGTGSQRWEPSIVSRRDEALVYLCASISLGCGIGLLWTRTAALAARVLLVSLVVWFLIGRLLCVLRSRASRPRFTVSMCVT